MLEIKKIEKKFIADTYKKMLIDFEEKKLNVNWDFVVITASNNKQAKYIEKQIEIRRKRGWLTDRTSYLVIPDLDGKRIGSGGATLNVLKVIKEFRPETEFSSTKILVVHSGGDSKRVPQYSVCGKLFSPVPRVIFGKYNSTLFDELIIGVSLLPERMDSGMLIAPGDTSFIFNQLQLDFNGKDAVALSVKENVKIGVNHGVFFTDEDSNVSEFLHKQSMDYLMEKGAVDSNENIDLDTGCVWFSSKLVNDLYSLISTGNEIDNEKFDYFVNDTVRLSFYADFLYPLSKNATLEKFQKEIPEKDFSENLYGCRNKIWETIGKYVLSVTSLNPAKFIHFGTTKELFELMNNVEAKYDYLNWKKNILSNVGDVDYSCMNSFIDNKSVISSNCYIENSKLIDSIINDNVIVSNSILDKVKVPSNSVIHTVKLLNGKFVTRLYGIKDNPKSNLEDSYLSTTLSDFLQKSHLDLNEVFENKEKCLWNAKIFPVADSPSESVIMSTIINKIIEGNVCDSELEIYQKANKESLESSFNSADTDYLQEFNEKLSIETRLCDCVLKIKQNEDYEDISNILEDEHINKYIEVLDNILDNEDYLIKAKLHFVISIKLRKMKDFRGEIFEEKCYKILKEEIKNSYYNKYKSNEYTKIKKDQVEIKLPARVNFCGTPSDAAPYCLEHGGNVINAAIVLNGKKPVVAVAKKMISKEIVLSSKDLNVRKSFTKIKDILDCTNPLDPFALHKAAIIASGILPTNQNVDLVEYLDNIGGGIFLETSVCLPKGSGLGTSSILSAALVKSIGELFGLDFDDQKVYSQVFLIEQLMTTGGGWQDQIGGISKGIKFIKSNPGADQEVSVEEIFLKESTKKELDERFVLIFSGQRRLAKNVLREEMNAIFKNKDYATNTINFVQSLCPNMKHALEIGDIDAFADCLTKHFVAIRKLDKGISNLCIDLIFEVCEDLICGKSICGAGGGGFLQVILKKGVSREQIKERLEMVFKDNKVKVWDTTFC